MSNDKISWKEWFGFSAEASLRDARWLGPIVFGMGILIIAALSIGVVIQFISVLFGIDSFASDAEKHTALRNSGLLVAAIIGIPFLVWRSVVAQKQVDITEQGHITDQINKAVANLGAEKSVKRIKDDGTIEDHTIANIEVRLGAIHALGRIGQDSVRDHIQIMDLLTAYIRENARADNAENCTEYLERYKKSLPFEYPNLLEDWKAYLSPKKDWLKTLRPRADIQAAIQVVGRLNLTHTTRIDTDATYISRDYRLDLRDTNLQGVDISELSMRKANLKNTRLDGAILNGARIEHADLTGANLTGASLIGASLKKTYLSNAKLEGANLSRACMKGVNLDGAKMAGAALVKANIEGVSFGNAEMMGVNLSGVTKDDSTNFVLASLEDAALTVRGHGQFSQTQNQIDTMFGDASVILRDDIDRPNHWPDWKLDVEHFQDEWLEWKKSRSSYKPPQKPS